MKPLRILLIGIEQSAWEGWRFGPPTAAVGDTSLKADKAPFQVLAEPLFDPERFDGCVFAIPNHEKVRIDWIADALKAGLPTLVMKMRPCSDTEMAILSSIPIDGLKHLYIGDQYRYHPGAMAVSSALQSGLIGNPVYTSWRCALPDPGTASWLKAYEHLTLEDLAYHHLMTLVEGCDASHIGSGTVYAASFNPGWLSSGTRGYGMLLVRMDNGLVMEYETRWGAADGNHNFFGEWLVEGKGGILQTNGTEATFTPRYGNTEQLLCPIPRYEGWSGIVDHFQEMLLGVDDALGHPLASYVQYTSVYHMICAGIQSVEENRAIHFS